MKGIKYIIMPNYTMTVLLEYIDRSLQFSTNAINVYFILPYYAGIMHNAFNNPLCSKLRWHNRWVPSSCPT